MCLTIPKSEGNVIDIVDAAQINSPDIADWGR